MNAELIKVLVAVVAVGISLAGLMLAGWRGIRREMRDMRQDISARCAGTSETFANTWTLKLEISADRMSPDRGQTRRTPRILLPDRRHRRVIEGTDGPSPHRSHPPGGATSNRLPGAACFTRRLGGASFQAPVFFARKGDFQSPTGKAVSSRPVFFSRKGGFQPRLPHSPTNRSPRERRVSRADWEGRLSRRPYSPPGGAISNRPLEGRFLAAPCSSPKWETSSKLPIPDNRRAPLVGAPRSRIAPPLSRRSTSPFPAPGRTPIPVGD